MQYSYESTQTGTVKNGSVVINLGGDAGIRADFPLEYEEDFYFGQRVTAFVGGKQKYDFTSSFMDIGITLWAYPLWFDLMRNELFFRTEDLTFCDQIFYGYELLKFVLEVKVGISACQVAAYDYALATEKKTYSCEKEYTYWMDAKHWNFKEEVTPILWDPTCTEEWIEDEEEYIEEASVEDTDVTDEVLDDEQ
jgi:hypothetical protein